MRYVIKNTISTIAIALMTAGSAFAGDSSTLASLYAENAVLSPGNGKVLTGRTEIENLFRSFFQMGLNNHKLEIVTAGGDDNTLYQVAKWGANGAEKDGIKESYGGITTSVYVKDARGKWVARSHVWNAGN